MKASAKKHYAVINLQGMAQVKDPGEAIKSDFMSMQTMNTQIHGGRRITYQFAAALNKDVYQLRKQRVLGNIRINES